MRSLFWLEEICSVTRRKPQETVWFSRIFNAGHSAKSSNRLTILKICPTAASSPLTVAKLCSAGLSLHLNKFSCAKTSSSISMGPSIRAYRGERNLTELLEIISGFAGILYVFIKTVPATSAKVMACGHANRGTAEHGERTCGS